jgi:hypothetical protein
MGKRRRQKRQRRQGDVPRLEGLAEVPGVPAFLPWGGTCPLVVPLTTWDDPTDFDREVCARGLKLYARPALPGDWPPGVDNGYVGVIVREAGQGVRVRVGIHGPLTAVKQSELN